MGANNLIWISIVLHSSRTGAERHLPFEYGCRYDEAGIASGRTHRVFNFCRAFKNDLPKREDIPTLEHSRRNRLRRIDCYRCVLAARPVAILGARILFGTCTPSRLFGDDHSRSVALREKIK